MTNLSKWNISIDHGPTSDETRDIVIESTTAIAARHKAEQWAKDNNLLNPIIGMPYQDNYDDFISWDSEDDEDFLDIVSSIRNGSER